MPDQLKVAFGRVRALWFRLRGVKMAAKVTVGRRVQFDQRRQISIGERVTLEDDVWFKLVTSEAGLCIGAHTFIGRGAEFDVSCRIRIGEHVLIGPGVFVTDHNHNIDGNARIGDQGCTANEVVIGDDVWLGANVVVLPGVTIGTGAVVGAGAVVSRSLTDYSINVGVPARPIGCRNVCSDGTGKLSPPTGLQCRSTSVDSPAP